MKFEESASVIEIDGAEAKIEQICRKRFEELYGERAPLAAKRLEEELNLMKREKLSGAFYLAYLLARRSHAKGYPTMVREAIGASFITYLLEITDYSPLSQEEANGIGMNFDIPYSFFWQHNKDTRLHIGVEFAGKYVKQAVKHMEKIIGKNRVFPTTSPGSFLILPLSKDLCEPLPMIKWPGGKKPRVQLKNNDISNRFAIFDCLGYDWPTILYRLQKKTGVSLEDISFDDPNVLDRIKNLDIEYFPLLCGDGARTLLSTLELNDFNDFVGFIGLRSSDVSLSSSYLKKADEINNLSCIEDVYRYLLEKGLVENEAFRISMLMRRGKNALKEKEACREILSKHNVSDEYCDQFIETCILHHKSRVVHWAISAYRIVWYEIYHYYDYKKVYSKFKINELDTYLTRSLH